MKKWTQRHFDICNSARYIGSSFTADYKQKFYDLIKPNILNLYGMPCGYDMQVITKECYTCYGTGMYSKISKCRNCDGTGTYDVSTYKLNRYLLNGEIYHIPTKVWTYNQDTMTNACLIFTKRIEHKGVKGNAELSYFILLFMYFRKEFYKDLRHIVKRRVRNIYWRLLYKIKDSWYRFPNKLPRESDYDFDDVPF